MFIPITCKPQEIGCLDPQTVATSDTTCMCGKTVPLKDTIAVWVNKSGEKKPAWYHACHQRCITAHVSMGHC